jgi:uncharacterized protein YjaZ
MSITPHYLLESGRLISCQDLLISVFQETVKKITNIIMVPDVDIVFCDDTKRAIPNYGIGGRTYNPHLVIIAIDPNCPEFEVKIKQNLSSSIAHELHHTQRWYSVGYGSNLFEAIITEGLASHFAQEITLQPPSPWCTALTKTQNNYYLKLAKTEFYNSEYNHSRWFYGSKNSQFPKWVGYTLGYNIVNNYLKSHPNQKSSTLVTTKAEAFLKYVSD